MAADLISAGEGDYVRSFCQVWPVTDPDDHWVTRDGAEPVVADDDDIPGAPETLMCVYVAAIHAAPFPASGLGKSCSLASAQAAQA